MNIGTAAETIERLCQLAVHAEVGPLGRFYLEKLADDIEQGAPEDTMRQSALNALSCIYHQPDTELARDILLAVFSVPHPPRPGHEDHLMVLMLNETAFELVPLLHDRGFALPRDKDILLSTRVIDIMRNGHWPHLDLVAPNIMFEQGHKVLYQLLAPHYKAFTGLPCVLPKLLALPAPAREVCDALTQSIASCQPVDLNLRKWASNDAPLRIQAMAQLEDRGLIDTAALANACRDEKASQAMSRLSALVQQQVMQARATLPTEQVPRPKARL